MSYKSVGDQLMQYALVSAVPHHKDSYCRSSLNRYYYDIFIQTREVLREANLWAEGQGHKDLPDMLNGKVKKKLKQEVRKIVKAGGGRANAETRHLRAAEGVLGKQADLLRLAYETRVLADYEPEIAVEILGTDFRLRAVSGSEASGWSKQSEGNLAVLRSSFRGLGIVD